MFYCPTMSVRPRPQYEETMKINFDETDLDEWDRVYRNVIRKCPGNSHAKEIFENAFETRLLADSADGSTYMKYNIPPPNQKSMEFEKFLRHVDKKYSHKVSRSSGTTGTYSEKDFKEIQNMIESYKHQREFQILQRKHHAQKMEEAQNDINYFDDIIETLESTLPQHRTGNQYVAPINYPF